MKSWPEQPLKPTTIQRDVWDTIHRELMTFTVSTLNIFAWLSKAQHFKK